MPTQCCAKRFTLKNLFVIFSKFILQPFLYVNISACYISTLPLLGDKSCQNLPFYDMKTGMKSHLYFKLCFCSLKSNQKSIFQMEVWSINVFFKGLVIFASYFCGNTVYFILTEKLKCWKKGNYFIKNTWYFDRYRSKYDIHKKV